MASYCLPFFGEPFRIIIIIVNFAVAALISGETVLTGGGNIHSDTIAPPYINNQMQSMGNM